MGHPLSHLAHTQSGRSILRSLVVTSVARDLRDGLPDVSSRAIYSSKASATCPGAMWGARTLGDWGGQGGSICARLQPQGHKGGQAAPVSLQSRLGPRSPTPSAFPSGQPPEAGLGCHQSQLLVPGKQVAFLS